MAETKTSYIAVKDSKNHIDDFQKFMSATTDALNIDASQRPDYFRMENGEKLENDILDAMKSQAPNFNFDPNYICHTPKQHFPDLISNNYFGVEVKSTQSPHWKSIGSSIVESLREDCVQRVFLMFGKLPKEEKVEFMCKPYEDCLYDISITHSPRYQIDMNTEKGKTIFDKLGITYDEFRNNPDQIKIMRNYYRAYYKEKGTMPWWIEEEDEQDNKVPTLLAEPSTGIRFWDDINDETTTNYLMTCMFQLFPEVIKYKSPKKYKKASLWLCSRYSIINPSFRDIFSAAGVANIWIDNELAYPEVPKAICTMLPFLNDVYNSFDNGTFAYDEISIFADYYKDGGNLKEIWLDKVKESLDTYKNLDFTIEELLNYKFDKLIKVKSKSDSYVSNYYMIHK